jgi:hypothetical protein
LLRVRCVYFRNPLELGGIYCFVNALKSVASWFVAAALYSQYFVAGTTESGLVSGMNSFNANYSGFLNSTGANSTGANATGGISAFCPGLRPFKATQASGANKSLRGFDYELYEYFVAYYPAARASNGTDKWMAQWR